jgi:hypothetical protein
MRVSVHLRRAVAKFFFLTNKRPEPDALHRSLHTLLADANPEPLSLMVDRLSSRLQRKNNLTPGDAKRQAEILARVVTRNASELPLRLSRQLRHHAFMLVHNALPTRWRDRHLPHTLPGTPCALCGRHPETSSHLFLQCCVSAAAIHSILIQSVNRAQVEVLTVATLDDFDFRSSLSSDDRVTLLSFSCAVWKAREQWVRHPTLRLSDASHLIATSFAALRRSAIAAPAKDRRPAQRREFLALLAALPCRSWRVFSDGSSFDSTRAGAGYVATDFRNDLLFCRSVFLGAASNNAAKLAALTYAANHCVDLLQLLPSQSRPLSFSLSRTSTPLTLAPVVGRPSRILMPSPPSNPPCLPYAP